ncbi:MAG: multidrug efflux MATE transporter NorM, partial [Eikenella sp.]|nr:multidrug efflux MATE transporter NorM [Eikenella sp.]
ALRGYKVTKLPMLIHALAFWVLGLGLGCWLAFDKEMGIYGFWTALVLSLAAAAVALLWCLETVSRERAYR